MGVKNYQRYVAAIAPSRSLHYSSVDVSAFSTKLSNGFSCSGRRVASTVDVNFAEANGNGGSF